MSQLEIRAALETALQNMEGMIPAANIVSSSGGVFVTDVPHGLASNMDVMITGHSTLAKGSFFVQVMSSTSFSLVNKLSRSSVVIQDGTGGTVLAQLTAWENVGFDPVMNYPYQKVNFIFAAPEEPTMGDLFYRERGFMQITLYYPVQKGPFAAMSRAELIRRTYPRGASFSSNGIVVNIVSTTQIYQGTTSDEIYSIYVRVPFYANIFS